LLSLVNSGTGFQVKTSSTAITNRSIAVSGNGLSISNGSGVSGDPTVALNGQVLNFANASFNGLVTLSTAGGITSSTITGTASQIDVANGTGVSGNPTISLSNDPVIPGTGGVVVPAGTTGQRGTAVDGNFRYNSTTASFEGYANGVWGSIPTGIGVNSISFGTTGLTPATATTGSVTVAGVLAIANGGTGNTSGTATTRVVVIADATSITVNVNTTDIATQANTQAVGTLTVNAPTGTAVNGQKFILRLTSTNVQTFAWNAVFAGSTDITLPTVSSGGGKTDYLGFIYNSTAAKWQMIAKVFGF